MGAEQSIEMSELSGVFIPLLPLIESDFPGVRQLTFFNEVFGYKRALAAHFKDFCPSICSAVGKLSTSNLSKEIYKRRSISWRLCPRSFRSRE
jgi:hypothetical protein